MSSILPPASDAQLDDTELAAHEFEIPCSYPHHERLSTQGAAWAVWLRNPRDCGCAASEFRYMCDPCWAYIHGDPLGRTTCFYCGAIQSLAANIVRAERL